MLHVLHVHGTKYIFLKLQKLVSTKKKNTHPLKNNKIYNSQTYDFSEVKTSIHMKQELNFHACNVPRMQYNQQIKAIGWA